MVVPKKYRTTVEAQPCGICHQQPFKYICPRCNLRYCSLTCYKNKSHLRCTEAFYRSAIVGELQSMPTAGPEDRQNMIRILHRFENEDVPQSSSATQHQGQHSPSEARKKALTTPERQEILSKASTKLERGPKVRTRQEEKRSDVRQGEHVPVDIKSGDKIEDTSKGTIQDRDLSGDDDDEINEEEEKAYLDLVSRLGNVDLEKESFESLWARLTPAEQKGFREMIMTRDHTAQPIYQEGEGTAQEVDEEEEEILKLMQATGRELKESLGMDDPLLADLDDDDLKALRETEIASLVPVWRPWWEIEAEEYGQLRKSTVMEAKSDGTEDNIVTDKGEKASTNTDGPGERLVLDEEILLRPFSRGPLVQEVVQNSADSSTSPSPSSTSHISGPTSSVSGTLPPMTKPPHPSLVYHLTALLFAYAATCRALNGDLTEFPEETLAHILDLCPFLVPQSKPPHHPSSTTALPPSSNDSKVPEQQYQQRQESSPVSTTSGTPLATINDFTTTLAVVQQASLASKNRWKGDTLRLELLVLLLQDLALLLASPQRCARALNEIRQVVDRISSSTSHSAVTAAQQSKMAPKDVKSPQKVKTEKGAFSKTFLFRVVKKLEFYESFVQSPWLLGTAKEQQLHQPALLDKVRAEVMMEGARSRQDLLVWERDLEASEKLRREMKEKKESSTHSTDTTSNKPLIEEL